MADLGNLWFSLGLDNTKFEQEWNAAFAKYQKQAKIDVGVNIQKADLTQIKNIKTQLEAFTKNFNSNAKASIDIQISPNTIDALKQLKALGGTKGEWAAVKEAVKAIKESVRAVNQLSAEEAKGAKQMLGNQKKITEGYKKQALWVQNLTNLVSNYFSLYAIKNFVMELAKVSGEFEKQRVTLQAMIGEMEGMDIFNKMKELSVVSPFEFKDLASYAKQLAAFSVPYEELYDTTKRLADVSAGLGVDMSRIILAYGQIRSAGVLRGTELRQLTEAGVPILDELVKKIKEVEGGTVGIGDVFDRISKKAISFETVKDIFQELTSEGGKFYQMQETQSKTLAGKIANLKDAYSIMLNEIGKQHESELKDSVDWLYKLMSNWESLGRILIEIFSAYAALQGVKILQWVSSQAVEISQLDKSFSKLYNSVRKNHGAVVSFLSAFSRANIIPIIVSLITGLTAVIWQANKAAKQFGKDIASIANTSSSELRNEEQALKKVKDAIEGAAEGSYDRREAISKFNSQYGQYLDNLLTEENATNNLASAYDRVTEAIRNKAKQQALSDAQAEVTKTFGTAVQEEISAYVKEAIKEGVTEEDARDVAAIIQQHLSGEGDMTKTLLQKMDERYGKRVWASTVDLEDAIKKYNNAYKLATDTVNAAHGNAKFTTKAEADLVERVNALYEERIKLLNAKGKTTDENYKKEKKEIESLKLQELAEGYGALGMHDVASKYIKDWEELSGVIEGWRGEITELVNTAKQPIRFAPKIDESFSDYVLRMRETWEDLQKEINIHKKSDPDGVLETLLQQEKLIKSISKKYPFSLSPKKDAKDATEEERQRVNALKTEYNWVLKVYDAYKKYKEQGLSDKDAKNSVIADFEDMPAGILAVFQDEHIISDWFDEELRSLAAVAAKGGSDIGNALKVSILQKLGKTNSDEALEILKLKAEVEKELSKWGLEDFALKGEGITLDISKILRDQTLANNEVAAKRNELLKKTEKLRDELGDEWYNKEVDRINNLYNLEISNNKKIAQEKINDLAETYAKELMNKAGVSDEFMSSLSDKSIKQLKEAEAILNRLTLGEIALPEGLSEEDLEKLDVTANELKNLVKSIISLKGADIGSEIGENTKENLKDALSAAKELVGSLRGFAKENSAFAGILDFVETGLDVASALEEGKPLKAVIQFITGVFEQIAAAKQYREEMERAADGFRDSITLSRREMKIAGEEFTTIFGEDVMSALKADSEAISDITRQLKNATTEVSNMRVVTRKGFWGIGVKTASLKDLAPQLFNADGSVNYSYLDEFLSVYGDKLDEGQKAILENLQSTYEQYEDAMSDINDYLSNIFSDTASTIADRMIDAFAATGNAATELGDIVNGVATQMAKDLIQSLLVDQYLGPAIERVKSLYNPDSKQYEQDPTLRIQKSILAMQDGLMAAESGAEEVTKILQGLSDMGIDFSTQSEKATDVLSGLTEAQQNLLMGYINGIRADVSYNKGMLSAIVTSVGTINNNIATAIVVWKQIEANTHRSADGVDRIIGFFESVMGPYDGGGGQAFQVNIA